ncbi:hypothetical protein AS189_13230 [Arthrobacter alpinus]|uniref:DUF3040 domain-containing protein n=1 Tax=Arthrobacter alpinus TaxID=656366 RepID=A0A0S2M198_9MICC|nr:hypothetical protein AS189_13230 [Arthrobacter alpinus]
MALSERESRILLAVEKELAASDPHLSKTFDILASSGPAIRHLLWGTAVLAVGIGALVYAIAVHSALIGAAAFMAMTEGPIWPCHGHDCSGRFDCTEPDNLIPITFRMNSRAARGLCAFHRMLGNEPNKGLARSYSAVGPTDASHGQLITRWHKK